jgi:predicted NACHT family NTPase
VAVGLWAAIEFMRNADPDGVALAMWLQELIGRYNSAGWTDHPIDLLALGQGGREIPAKSAVENWVDEKAGRVLVLTGTFGSGKTWTLRWLAQRLAARWIGGDPSVPVPVLVSLTQLSDSDVMTREQLRQLAWPAPISEQILSSGNSHVLLLLDGLDELLSLDGSDLRAKKVLTFIAAAEPPSTRFLISCRADVLASEPALRELVL